MDDNRIHPGTPHRRIVGGVPCADIDFSPDGDMLPARVRARLSGLFGGISGVSVQRVATAMTGGISVEIEGWSPSLHRIEIQYVRHVEVPTGRQSLEDVDRAFTDAIIEQVERSKAGVHMGLHAPMPLKPTMPHAPVRGSGPQSSRPEMRHLLVDASLPALAASDGEDPVALLHKLIESTATSSSAAWDASSA
jgi:hypothetical protein